MSCDDKILGRTDGQTDGPTDGRSDCTPRPAFTFGDAGKNGIQPGVSLILTKSATKPENQTNLQFTKRRSFS